MAAKSFKEWLEERHFSKSLVEHTRFTDAVGALDEVVAAINDDLPHKDMVVSLLSGFATNLGQQYVVTIKARDETPDIKLFRAYVTLDGSQVSFDFYDEKPTVVDSNRDAIFDAVSRFMVRPSTIAQFQQLKDHLDRRSVQGRP